MSADASPEVAVPLPARDRLLTDERAERLRSASARIALILILIALFLGGWEFLKWVTDSPRTTLPHFHEVVNYLFTTNSQGDKVWLDTGRNLRLTFIEALTGLAVAIVAGFAAGTLMALSRWTGRGIMPFVIGAQTVRVPSDFEERALSRLLRVLRTRHDPEVDTHLGLHDAGRHAQVV